MIDIEMSLPSFNFIARFLWSNKLLPLYYKVYTKKKHNNNNTHTQANISFIRVSLLMTNLF